MRRFTTLLLLCTLCALIPLFAEDHSEGDESYSTSNAPFQWVALPWSATESSGDGLLEGAASSDGHFRLSFTPQLTLGKLSLQLDLTLAGMLHIDPFSASIDLNDWVAPVRGDAGLFAYTTTVLHYYSSFIRSFEYGTRFDAVYARYGKLMGITLGDGALLNSFFDLGVPIRSSRPGLEVTIDGGLFNRPKSGFHFVTTDLFSSSLTAWRIWGKPLYPLGKSSGLSKLELGLSFAAAPPSSDTAMMHLLALDTSYPLYEWEYLKLSFFSDLIAQSRDGAFFNPSLGWRIGIWGRTKSYFTFNASVTKTLRGDFYVDYLDSNVEMRTFIETQALLLSYETLRLDGRISLNLSRLGLYWSTRMVGNLTGGDHHDLHFTSTLHLDKRLFNIVSLDFSYEKLYPTTTGERFFDGLQTLRNVVLTASAVIKVKPYTFDLGLNVDFDDRGDATYKLSTVVRVTIL